ncbi:SHOCT domain-containing protein [Nocardia lijiangensis]|uniref:SHOCT domain-containing protein n=1 Tax=Nocardia lijiangensis TaxID=299618 RepID=UPI00082E9E19|nr:hypothetical protein [Nocardia lijiangensis]
MMVWYGNDMHGWGYAWMSLGMVLFWGLLITALVVVVRVATRPDLDRRAEPPAVERLLAERFARGEIDGKEYVSRLETLREQGAGHA